MLAAGVSNAFLAGDLFNLFVSFEMLLFASYVLLTLGGTGARIRAGTIYVVVNVRLLVAVPHLPRRGVRRHRQPQPRPAGRPAQRPARPRSALVLQLLLLTTFSIKAAVFPLSFWLPDSYPTAPAPVTAVFAGLLTKVGIYAIIRTQTLLFPDSPLTDLLLGAALLTLVVGHPRRGRPDRHQADAVLHPGQPHRLHDVRHRLGTTAGYSGAIFYVAHHITIQTTLFLVLGLVERRGGSTSLIRLGGLARLAPAAGRAVLRARHEPRRHPPDVGLPRQGGAHRGRSPASEPRWPTRWSPPAWSPAC